MTTRLLGAAGLAAVLAAGVSGLAPTAGAAPAGPTANVSTPAPTWSLASDMAADPDGNPIADSYGNADVWSWLSGSGTDADAYRLDDQLGTQCGTDQLYVHTDSSSPSPGFPLVSYYAGDQDLTCGTVTIPAHSVDVHPSPTEDAIIAWTSPIDGTVSVSGTVADNDPNGGDGFDYQLLDGSDQLAAGDVDNGGSADVKSKGDVTVAKGDTLYLLVGNREGYTYDSTRVDLTITDTNPAPKLAAAAPHALVQGQTRTVRLFGQHFADGATVSLEPMDGVTFEKVSLAHGVGAQHQDVFSVLVNVAPDAPATLRNWQVTNPDGVTTTCDATNCALVIGATPTVNDVDPTTAPQGQTTSINLTGTNFEEGLQAKVSGPGAMATNVVVQDANHATFDLTVTPTAKIGARTLTVSLPRQGKSSYKKAVTITAAAQ